MKSILLPLCCCIVSLCFSQKNVLFEKFTNAYCGVCPDATLNLIDITTAHPDVIWISHHKPVTWTDNPLTNEQSIALWDELNVAGVPTGMVDRRRYNNEITMSRVRWAERIEAHRGESSPFEISIQNVVYDKSSRQISFDAETTVMDSAPEASYRITAYIVEDSVNTTEQHSYWNDVPGHPLEGRGKIIWDYYHRNVVRTILEDHWGVKDIIPSSPVVGSTYNYRFNYTIPEAYRPKRMKLVVQIAAFDEEQGLPEEVQDAAVVQLKDLNLSLTNTKEDFTEKITIYPNPSSSLINVLFSTRPSQLYIVDQHGKCILEYTPTNNQSTIDISNLPAGAYALISDHNGQLTGQRFMVAR